MEMMRMNSLWLASLENKRQQDFPPSMAQILQHICNKESPTRQKEDNMIIGGATRETMREGVDTVGNLATLIRMHMTSRT